ncbi:MAG: peptidoglycan bridge formation glycyltransferase FemA/FemB family protein [Sulfuricurvum sp.]|jgi:lipid II:glycine glycyltransferase (peptidoglycan interpeptide bridge formation enzyme)|uniref:GNAT family N-acetyltransferase n=1 Tax=Sulfuricurvum sp. TaxID=2025608 RepID=UPI0025D22A4C|nr:GNAT family N-acetyltransferase [Sulfuricurvum sp.]MCK9372244.1 peptidoglycan bridge formation glycyltransferase FemA/FemB family protein [Sulfuricurvum sp.]
MYESVFTANFVERWGDAFAEFYRYKKEGKFYIVPSLSGKKTYSYVPGLTYTDRNAHACFDLLSFVEGKSYTIRTIDPDKKEFAESEPVTMRLDISSGEKEPIMKNFNATARNQVRQAERAGLRTAIGNEKKLLDDFYKLYTMTMYRHGTPPFSRALLDTLVKYIELEVIVTYVADEPASGMIMTNDSAITWNPYGGSNPKFSKLFANQLMYRDAIYHAIERGQKIFDFGRSPYTKHGGTYLFKQRMGARPVGLCDYRPQSEDIYSKYSTAAAVWKRLPKPVADFVGPKLRRYLADA